MINVPKINLIINLDADLKKDAQKLFHELGMDLTTAINIFLRKAVSIRGIPFDIKQSLSNETINSLNEFEEMKNKSCKYKRYSSLQEVPNNFTKTVKRISNNGNLSVSQAARLDFWTRFNSVLEMNGNPFNKRKASTAHWYDVAVGDSQCHIAIDLVNKEHRVRVGFWIIDNKELFDYLYKNKEKIESDFGNKLAWNRLNSKKASRVCAYIKGLNFKNPRNYPELMQTIINMVVKLRAVIKAYL